MALSAIHSLRPALPRVPLVACGLALFGLFVFLVPAIGHWQEIATGGNRLLFSLLTVALVGVVAFLEIPDGLAARGLVYLGAISYSVYLIHPLVVTAGQLYTGFPSPVAGMLTCIAVTLLVASAVYRWYERPLMQLYRRRSIG